MVFDSNVAPVAVAQQEFGQIYPRPGWVEHDPEEIWTSVLATARQALRSAGLAASDIAALGIANQRETVVVWDRRSGRPIHNAIVWQDRRTAKVCERLERAGNDALIAERSGLRLDPYFSATKIGWLLDTVDGAREAAETGHLAFGTVDSFLLWRLTDGAVHATDATNASRTLLFDIHRGVWDQDLLQLFGIPPAMLPRVRDSAGMFGTTAHLGGPIAVRGIAGDQQAALIGQACFRPGMVKSTCGTGCFALLNTGREAIASRHRLITTVAYQLDGVRTYALEGSIFVAGAAVQWLRDGLGLIASADETGTLAAEADPLQQVYMVPAFVGLGAPHWDSAARALLTGMTRGTTRRELARAALECVAYQTRDLIDAMQADLGDGWSDEAPTVIRVDGGMSASDWTMQFLADMLAAPVDRPSCLETTAVGAAYLAGMAAGLYPDAESFAAGWRGERRFEPSMAAAERETKYRGWQDAVARTLLRS
jgi:glycerol kinase